ncbi:MAG: fasciclin domain-containing protein [Myxococcales bacterium]|nr:MAG: fasciclin domain-containing protein [Myxococcales bacterium]
MKTLSWISVTLLLSQGIVACDSEDSVSTPGAAGSGVVGTAGSGTAGSGTAGTGTATGGSGTTTGGSGSTSGSPSTGGTGGTSAGAGGAGGTGGSGTAALKDIVDTAVAAGGFTKLAEALTKADLVTALKGAGPFTVFAPTDKAFMDFETQNPGELGKLTKEELAAVLQYHVVSGAAVGSQQLKDDQVFKTLNGSPVLVDLTGGVKVGAATVTMPDVKASNGVIHVIDKILLPPKDDIVATAVAAGTFTKLAAALTSAGLVDTLKGPGPFTVFAPTDAAFDKLGTAPTGNDLKNVLLYHVVSGAVGSGDLTAGMVPTLLENKSLTVALTGGVKVNGATVAPANIIAKNGVIHVVDTVLVPQ